MISIKPWNIYRQVLWLVGVLGLLLLWAALLLAFVLQGGFGPGKPTSPPGLAELFGAILFSIPGIYYIVVAHRAWTRRLWRIGLVIHGLTFAIFIATGAPSGIPVVLVWAVAWIVFARRNTFTDTPV